MRINPYFFIISFLLPFMVIFSGFSLIVLFVIAPYFNIKVSDMMASSAVPTNVRTQTGFDEFKFEELPENKPDVKGVTVVEPPKEIPSNPPPIIETPPITPFKVVDTPAIFSLTIPKLRIINAKVETNSTNLDPIKILGHYKGTALPGEKGNAFIYGHSVLPFFFNPKDYKTIFSTLPNLKEKDKFYVDYAGRSYTYEVIKKVTLKPDAVDVYDQNPAKLEGENSTVTLMTCVPPGSKTYRMLVIAKLLESQ